MGGNGEGREEGKDLFPRGGEGERREEGRGGRKEGEGRGGKRDGVCSCKNSLKYALLRLHVYVWRCE